MFVLHIFMHNPFLTFKTLFNEGTVVKLHKTLRKYKTQIL